MPEDRIKKLAGLYEDFLPNDVAFIFGGCIILTSMSYSYYGSIDDTISNLPHNFYAFILFIIFSYLAGFIAYNSLRIKYKRVKTDKTIENIKNLDFRYYGYASIDVLSYKFDFITGKDIHSRIKRDLYFYHLSLTLAISCLISSFIILITFFRFQRYSDIILFFSLILVSLLCRRITSIYLKIIALSTKTILEIQAMKDKGGTGEAK